MTTAQILAVLLTAAWAAVVTVVDLRTLRIPAPLAVLGVGVAAVVALSCDREIAALLGALALTGCYLGLRLISPASLGGGDLRLAPAVGALSAIGGPAAWVLAAVGAFALTALFGVVMLAIGGRVPPGRGAAVAHGPAMVLVALVVAVAALGAGG